MMTTTAHATAHTVTRVAIISTLTLIAITTALTSFVIHNVLKLDSKSFKYTSAQKKKQCATMQ